MVHIALYEPEIPPNTGNIIRLCANVGSKLHIIEPTGFGWDDKRLRRAGLDYHEFAEVVRYPNFDTFLNVMEEYTIYACSTHGRTPYHKVKYKVGDVLLFGPETRGLPAVIRESLPKEQVIRIPMKADSRSLNLSNAVAIIMMESLRQLDFPNCE